MEETVSTRSPKVCQRIVAPAVTVPALAVAAPSALAHVERPSYWPNPAPDTSVSPPAGGAPPKVRSLASALPPRRRKTSRRAAGRRNRGRARLQTPAFTGAYKSGRSYRARDGQGRVRVVCRPNSLTVGKREISRARGSGYRNRPTQPLQRLPAKQAKRWRSYNERFFAACGFREIQP